MIPAILQSDGTTILTARVYIHTGILQAMSLLIEPYPAGDHGHALGHTINRRTYERVSTLATRLDASFFTAR